MKCFQFFNKKNYPSKSSVVCEYFVGWFSCKLILTEAEVSYVVSNEGWLVEFYGISTFVGYLTPNPFLSK